ncbi:MAG: hypothetical protein RLZZ501_2094 [Pseudomonadota bacterium]|jgi:disulfide bond formation protein DsbB
MSRSPRPSFPAVPALVVLAGCVAALAIAFAAQYGAGARPCVLCLTERVPYAVAVPLLALACWPVLTVGRRRRLVGLAALALAVNTAIAAYHVGVEQNWWHSAVCGSTPPGLAELDPATLDLAAAMSRPVDMPPCDQPSWSYHGLTFAALNIAYSALLALVLVRALSPRRRR